MYRLSARQVQICTWLLSTIISYIQLRQAGTVDHHNCSLAIIGVWQQCSYVEVAKCCVQVRNAYYFAVSTIKLFLFHYSCSDSHFSFRIHYSLGIQIVILQKQSARMPPLGTTKWAHLPRGESLPFDCWFFCLEAVMLHSVLQKIQQ